MTVFQAGGSNQLCQMLLIDEVREWSTGFNGMGITGYHD